MSSSRAAERLAEQTSALRLAEALRDVIEDAVAEVSSVAPQLPPPELRPVPSAKGPSEAAMRVQLSDREREVVALVARGLGTADIGARMYLAERTVKNYVAMALAKLNATNRAHAVAIAVCMGFIDPTLDELLGMGPTEMEGGARP